MTCLIRLFNHLATGAQVISGAGGDDSQDWTAMLETMYSDWASRRGYRVGHAAKPMSGVGAHRPHACMHVQVRSVSRSPGAVGRGLRNATMRIQSTG